jgi:hypothetical protein
MLQHTPVYIIEASVSVSKILPGMTISIWSDGGTADDGGTAHTPFIGMVGTVESVEEGSGDETITMTFKEAANTFPGDKHQKTFYDKPVRGFTRAQLAFGCTHRT